MNYAYIKRISNIENICEMIRIEINNKFKFDSTYNINSYNIEFNINGVIFIFFYDDDNIIFYDSPCSAIIYGTEYYLKYKKNSVVDGDGAFHFLYDYIKNFVASFYKTIINSDGIGEYEPNIINSYQDWLNYKMEYYDNLGKLYKLFIFVSRKSFKKLYKNEIYFFPTLNT